MAQINHNWLPLRRPWVLKVNPDPPLQTSNTPVFVEWLLQTIFHRFFLSVLMLTM
jgi:hypothetical protein